jgi:hypothetical protein
VVAEDVWCIAPPEYLYPRLKDAASHEPINNLRVPDDR